MPYIKQEDRQKFEQVLDFTPHIASPGELNFVITLICQQYINDKGISYQTLNDVCGALTNANLELYRRITAGYEDKKIQENGDVY